MKNILSPTNHQLPTTNDVKSVRNGLAILSIIITSASCSLGPLPNPKFDVTATVPADIGDKVTLYDCFQLRNGDIIAAGKVTKNAKLDALVLRYSSDGTLKESASFDFDGTAASDDDIYCTTIDSSENIYLGGNRKDASGNQTELIHKITTAGTLTKATGWPKTYSSLSDGLKTIQKIVFANGQIAAVTGFRDGRVITSTSGRCFKTSLDGVDAGGSKNTGYFNIKEAAVAGNKVVFGGNGNNSTMGIYDMTTGIYTQKDYVIPTGAVSPSFNIIRTLIINNNNVIAFPVVLNFSSLGNNVDKAYYLRTNATDLTAISPTSPLNVDTTGFVSSSTETMIASSETDYFYYFTGIVKSDGSFYTQIDKLNYNGVGQSTLISRIQGVFIRKVLKLNDGRYLLLGEVSGIRNRLIRINTRGEIE
jgi:hypothetical protein